MDCQVEVALFANFAAGQHDELASLSLLLTDGVKMWVRIRQDLVIHAFLWLVITTCLAHIFYRPCLLGVRRKSDFEEAKSHSQTSRIVSAGSQATEAQQATKCTHLTTRPTGSMLVHP